MRLEGWILRRLVCHFTRIAKKPHTPRSSQLRRLMTSVGMSSQVAIIQWDSYVISCNKVIYNVGRQF